MQTKDLKWSKFGAIELKGEKTTGQTERQTER